MISIEKIHSSDNFGIFVEVGCGLPVSSALLSVSGASNTVFFSESPYHKKYVEDKYQIDTNKVRAVSSDYIDSIIKYYNDHYFGKCYDGKTINTIYVSSFQVGDVLSNLITHGWIGLQYHNKKVLYHITLREKLSRFCYIEKIKNIGLRLLILQNQSINKPENLSIDIILSDDIIYNIFNYMNHEGIICYNKENKLCRAEDLLRNKKMINMYTEAFIPDVKDISDKEICILFKFNNTVNYQDKVKEINNKGFNCIIIGMNCQWENFLESFV